MNTDAEKLIEILSKANMPYEWDGAFGELILSSRNCKIIFVFDAVDNHLFDIILQYDLTCHVEQGLK